MLRTGLRGALAAIALAAATAIDTPAIALAGSGGGPAWWRHRPRKPWGGSVKRHARAMAKKARKG